MTTIGDQIRAALTLVEAATEQAYTYAYEQPTDALTAHAGGVYGRLTIVRGVLRELAQIHGPAPL